MSNKEHGTNQDTNRRKLFEGHSIAVGVEERTEEYRPPPQKKGVIQTGREFYRPQLKSTYKETKKSEDINDELE